MGPREFLTMEIAGLLDGIKIVCEGSRNTLTENNVLEITDKTNEIKEIVERIEEKIANYKEGKF